MTLIDGYEEQEMKTQVVDLQNNPVGEVELAQEVFGVEVREHLFWEVINWQRAKRRAGTHKAKTRSEVRGGGKKPWRQKGTGRARAGSTRSPVWVGGGTVHGPQPRDYSYRMPRKKRRAALRSALAAKLQQENLRVVDALTFEHPKTKEAVRALGNLGASKALFVDVTRRDEGERGPVHNDNLRLSVRNLKQAKYLAAEGLNIEDLLRYDVLIMSQQALEQVQEALKS
ncbi:MAG: 50S ribosomal protein L4 [Myxococcota bacterium]